MGTRLRIIPSRLLASHRQGAARWGLVLAACAGGLAIVVIAVSYRAAPSQNPANAPSPVSPTPQVMDVPSGRGGKALKNLGQGEDLFVQMADRTDPTRVAGQLTAAKSTPLEGKRYRMEKPRVWSFMRDGRTVYVEADSGQALIPDLTGSRPEDGAIKGHVVAKLFPATADGSLPDPETTPALLTLRSDELKFDLRSGEFRFPGAVSLNGVQFDFEGRDVLILVNEVAQQLELVRIERTTRCVFRPQEGEETPPKEQAAATPAKTTPAPTDSPERGPTTAVAKTPKETFYELTLEGNPRVAQGARELTGERITGFVRLVDNGLRANAIAGSSLRAQADPASVLLGGKVKIRTAAFRPKPAQPPARGPAESNQAPIEFSWGGVMEFKAAKQVPAQLVDNDVFLKVTSSTDGGVAIRDEEQHVTVRGRMVQYFATTQAGSIEGSEASPATLEKLGSGRAAARRFDATPATGRVTAQGMGFIEGSMSSGVGKKRKAERLTWSTSAEFLFGVEQGRMSSRLERLHLEGDVKAAAADEGGGLSAQTLVAQFTRIDRAASFLSRVVATGGSKGWDSHGGSLEAEELDITLARSGQTSQSQPTSMKASGNVRASQRDSVLTASSVEASLDQLPKEDGRFATVVVEATATGDVKFRRDDGVNAFTHLLTTRPDRRQVTLSGPESRVGRGDSAIQGNTITMDGDKGTLAVEGAGEFTHKDPGREAAGDTPGVPATQAKISWARGMTFDDATGIVTCEGAATADLRRGILDRDSLKARKVVVAIGPAPAKNPGQPATTTTNNNTGADPLKVVMPEGGDRPLLWAVAEGEAADPASIELRRFDASNPSTVARLMYLEGASIRADNQAGRLEVASGGKLLTMDRERAATAPKGGMATRLSGDTKGTALFGWSGSMTFDRSQGRAILRDGVTVTHKALADGAVTQLRCSHLTADLDVPGPESKTASAAFRAAQAQGSVWLSARDSEMVADALTFDALTSTVHAVSSADQPAVTLTGRDGASPVTAREIRWNLRDNQVTLTGARPIVAPR
ncbi:MAG: hypothetical protein WCK33_08655 [Phycisphaerae bacterium]